MKNRSTLKLSIVPAILGLLLAVIIIVAKTQITSAINYLLPDNSFFSADANVHLVIAQEGDGSQITLEAPETWVKLFFDPSQSGTKMGFQMAAADFICDPSNSSSYYQIDSQGLNGTCNDPGGVEYDFFCSDGSGKNPNLGSQFYSIRSDDPKFVGPGFHQVLDPPGTINTSCPLVGSGPAARYIAYVQARWLNSGPSEGRINGFKVASSVIGALSSYWAQGTGYAVQNRIDQMSGSGGEDGYFNFEFAPQCDEPPSQTASLVWTDADATSNGGAPGDGTAGGTAGAFPGDNEPSFDLLEGDIGGTNWQTVAHVDSGGTTVGAGYSLSLTPPNIGGNGTNRQLQFTAKNDKVYSWKWYNVNYNNGVQMTLPFDSYYYKKTCGGGTTNIAKGTIDAWNCNSIPGWAYDADSPSTAVGIHIYINNKPPGSPGDFYDYGATNVSRPDVNSKFGITGTHGFDWTIPSKYKDGLPHSFYIYVRGVDSAGNGGGTDGDANNPEITAYSNGATSGSFTCGGTIVGRAFYDDNGNGTRDGGDRIVESPPGSCGGSNVPASGISVKLASTGASSNLNLCDPDAYYKVSSPTGTQTINIILPPGWISTNGSSRTFTVTDGATTTATPAQYFGVQIKAPTVVTKCVNSSSLADISWGPPVIPASSFFADVDTDPNYFGPPPAGGQYWNKGTGSGTSTTAPTGFNTWPSAGGPALDFTNNPPATYWTRVFYSGPNVHTASASFTTKGCPKLTCGAVSATPTQPEDGKPFDMVVSFNNIGYGDLASSANMGVIFPGFYNNSNSPYTNRPLPGGQVGKSNPPINLTVPAGIYAVTWTVTGDAASNSLSGPPGPTGTCTGTVTVSSKPYFRVFNGDVIAGSNAVACPSWSPSGTSAGAILAFSNGSGNGAGTQLFAQALAAINGFSSGQGRSPGPGGPDKGLTFANSAPALTYGGNFNAGGCPPDFWANRPTGTVSSAGNLNINPSFNGTRLYQATGPGGNVNLSTAANKLADGQVLVLYVDGDATITENIVAQNTTWSSANDIPSFVLVAHGNIYIDYSVDAIDGVLVAQPNGASGGNIYTCTDGHTLPTVVDMVTPAPLGKCKKNPLTITGAVIARTIKLFRTSDSVGNSTNGEQPTGPTAHAAERFIYSPEVWLRANLLRGSPTLGTFDAITNLPPVF